MRVRYVYPAAAKWIMRSNLTMGKCYEAINEIPKAKEAYQNVIKQSKDAELIAEAEKRLQNLDNL